MEIKEGYVYHIKNDYFELVNVDRIEKLLIEELKK